MDPNATLAALRNALNTATDYDSSTAMVTQEEAWMTAAELFGALDGWLSRGGFLPSDWDRK